METSTTTCLYMLTMLTLFLPLHVLSSYDYNDWIAPSSPTMPRSVQSSAVGYDSTNDRIWILGSHNWGVSGYANPRQLMSYDINSNVFTKYSATALPSSVYGWGDFYTQIDDIVYMLVGGISTFNVNTAQFTYQSHATQQWLDSTRGCLSSIDDALFVLGATTPNASYYRFVQVLNLTNSTWITSPALNQGRIHASCIVHPYNNALYAIGGNNGTSYLQTIEKLYVGDLAHLSQYNWEFIDSLPR
eukprot:164227_1